MGNMLGRRLLSAAPPSHARVWGRPAALGQATIHNVVGWYMSVISGPSRYQIDIHWPPPGYSQHWSDGSAKIPRYLFSLLYVDMATARLDIATSCASGPSPLHTRCVEVQISRSVQSADFEPPASARHFVSYRAGHSIYGRIYLSHHAPISGSTGSATPSYAAH